MDNFDRHSHWEKIYKTKQVNEVGWYQPVPLTSLQFLEQFNIPVTAKIIDVGGGDSFFVDHLLDLGYQDITVLDISETAILRAKERLGDAAAKVKWIVADAADFKPAEKYDFWHDRAAFHFLTRDSEVESYIDEYYVAEHKLTRRKLLDIELEAIEESDLISYNAPASMQAPKIGKSIEDLVDFEDDSTQE